MSFSLIIRPEAESELRFSYDWYEERREGLGDDFALAVEACLNRIHRLPLSSPVVYKNIHRVLVRRFPFQVLYFIEGESVIVIAIFHSSRNPSRWRNRK